MIRRKRDQESAALIEEVKYKEQLRQIEKEKKLKREEMEAKKRIKEQIEADKRARKEKVVPTTKQTLHQIDTLPHRQNRRDWRDWVNQLPLLSLLLQLHRDQCLLEQARQIIPLPAFKFVPLESLEHHRV